MSLKREPRVNEIVKIVVNILKYGPLHVLHHVNADFVSILLLKDTKLMFKGFETEMYWQINNNN